MFERVSSRVTTGLSHRDHPVNPSVLQPQAIDVLAELLMSTELTLAQLSESEWVS